MLGGEVQLGVSIQSQWGTSTPGWQGGCLDEALMTALFLRLRVIYPQKWDDQYESEEMVALAMQEWAEALAGLSVEQVKRGIDAVRVHCQWPPSIAEFVGYATRDDKLTLACFCEFVPLARPVQSPDVVRGALIALRSGLRGVRSVG